MKFRLALSVGLVASLAATVAHAQTVEDAAVSKDYPEEKTRRSGFTIGTSGGFGFGRAQGYPNEIDKIGRGAYAANTKLGLGSGGAVWLGVAFNDYVSFGLGMGGLGLSGNDREASAGAFLFHVDVFPLFKVDPALRDLAVFAHLGTGPLEIKGGAEPADGGLMGYVEGGVAYEALRVWQIALGPSVSVMHMWSESAKLSAALVGGRLAFYSGP